jgi:pimeloyl-ACP methyl ester carboxylesterase
VSQQSVTSKDGTPIAYWTSGNGPPLVLVHGTPADHTRWHPVLPAFEQHFSVCAVDRRGRGGSGDPEDDYAIEREFEDISAVVDSLGEPTILLGHSYGALCALEAALLTTNVRTLVLYEPGIEVAGEQIYPQEVIERLEALLEVGDREGVVTFMREVAGLPTLLLSGGESPAALRKAAEAVEETLSDSRIVVMAGQGHAAMDTGTDLFQTEVLRFVEGRS